MKEILFNIESKETRCAILRHGKLQDLIIERSSSAPITGNIYRGKVTNVLHNIQSAFIDINEGDNGFIHISDILENTQKFQEMFDMDFEAEKKKKSKQKSEDDIGKLMEVNTPVLVQVVKEPIGSKGARLTSNISVAGRYLVLLPNSSHRGVSRKIQDRVARERLKKLIRAFEMPVDMGLICRTVSMNASNEALIEEANELLKQWNEIKEKFGASSKPTLLLKESDLIKRMLIRAIDKKFDRIILDDLKVYRQCKDLYRKFADDHTIEIIHHKDNSPLFDKHGVENEIEKALKRKIYLPSGGYLYFDKTEAMCTIDVNSGRSKTKKGSSDLEESLVRINMEAADEIARQLRLRNIGGLIICDFIDMRARKNQRRVLDRLKEAMRDDSAKTTFLGMSEFGLVEMTRQRNRESLGQTLFTHCPYCDGLGNIKNNETVTIELERAIKRLSHHHQGSTFTLTVHPELEKALSKKDKEGLTKILKKTKSDLSFGTDDTLHMNHFEITCNGQTV